jgi:hypothetical protein
VNEDQCQSCGKWVKWDRNRVGDCRFHKCPTGERWVMSVHGAPVRIAADDAEEPDDDR